MTPREPHWYMIFINICPVCGGKKDSEWRERRIGPRPEKWEDRHKYDYTYDGCMDHEFY